MYKKKKEYNKTILILIRDFPYNFPMSIRIRSFIEIFEKLNYKCAVVCFNYTGDNSIEKGVCIYKNVNIYPMNANNTSSSKWSTPHYFSRTLNKAIEIERPQYIFSCSMQQVFPGVYRLAKKNHIPIILESSEWYDPSTFKNGIYDFHYILHRICWKFYYPKVDAVIAISRLLYNHYKEHLENVIRIPTIMEINEIQYRIECKKSNQIVLLFAGSLARTKDSIKEFYEALNYVSDSKRFFFEIVGVRENDLKVHLGEDLYEKYKSQTKVYGRVHQSIINQKYLESDFGIFFRPKQRSSEAGFSTKLGEGMSAGTPFIVNETGDIPLYLKDGENAFIVNNVTSIAEVYEKILTFGSEEMKRMRRNARETAELYFNYSNYIDNVKELIDNLEEKKL